MKQQPIKRFSATMLLALGVMTATSAIAGDKGLAYVSNQDGGVMVIDLATMETKGSLDIGAKGPRGILSLIHI